MFLRVGDLDKVVVGGGLRLNASMFKLRVYKWVLFDDVHHEEFIYQTCYIATTQHG